MMNWKEVVNLIEVLSRNLPDGTEENLKSLSVRIADVPAEMRTEHLPEYECRELPLSEPAP
jgi:hypothetical protein